MEGEETNASLCREIYMLCKINVKYLPVNKVINRCHFKKLHERLQHINVNYLFS